MKSITFCILCTYITAMLLGCGSDSAIENDEEPAPPCTIANEDEIHIQDTVLSKQDTVIEFVEHALGKVIYLEASNIWIVDIDPDNINNETSFVPSNQYTLVPCNLSEKHKVKLLKVTLSGRKMSSCGIVTFPQVSGRWGCKFEITGIKFSSDQNQ